MVKRRKDQRVLELNAAEKSLLIQAMIHFRNMLITQNKPTEDVSDILLRLL